jgi:glycosyltransferase involved in cell wall biosynthesis
MVIAHLLSSFQVGGQEKVALDLASRQRERGHEVLAVSLAQGPEGPLGAALRAAGVGAHTVGKLGPSLDPTLPMRLGALLRRKGVEVVHAHNPQPLIYGSLAAKLAGAAMIQTRHGVAHHSQRQDWLVRQATRLVDASVFVSRELAATLEGAGQVPGRQWVIENGVDLSRFYPDASGRAAMRAALGIPSEALVVGTVSRLTESKNVPGLVRAAAPLLGERTRLVIVGDGADRPAVERAMAESGQAGFIHALGARSDVAELVRAFDLFALFSRTEGHPIVVLEAMATAVPVLATPVGGIPGILDEGETGFLVPVDDEAALRARLQALLAAPADLISAGLRARAVALQRYAADRMVDEYLALYARWGQEWAA